MSLLTAHVLEVVLSRLIEQNPGTATLDLASSETDRILEGWTAVGGEGFPKETDGYLLPSATSSAASSSSSSTSSSTSTPPSLFKSPSAVTSFLFPPKPSHKAHTNGTLPKPPKPPTVTRTGRNVTPNFKLAPPPPPSTALPPPPPPPKRHLPPPPPLLYSPSDRVTVLFKNRGKAAPYTAVVQSLDQAKGKYNVRFEIDGRWAMGVAPSSVLGRVEGVSPGFPEAKEGPKRERKEAALTKAATGGAAVPSSKKSRKVAPPKVAPPKVSPMPSEARRLHAVAAALAAPPSRPPSSHPPPSGLPPSRAPPSNRSNRSMEYGIGEWVNVMWGRKGQRKKSYLSFVEARDEGKGSYTVRFEVDDSFARGILEGAMSRVEGGAPNGAVPSVLVPSVPVEHGKPEHGKPSGPAQDGDSSRPLIRQASTSTALAATVLSSFAPQEFGAPPSSPLRRPRSNTSTDIRETCIVCMDARRTVLFLPCKHFAACEICARGVAECPCCRGKVESRIFGIVVP